MNKETARNEFLMRMYDQMFNDINRHIMVVWQPIIMLGGTIAALILQGKNILPISISTTMIILVVAWVIAHVYDSSFWYNRNLAIISNIEKQFLHKDDVSEICFYFASHRRNNKMISHLRIQYYLAVGIGIMAVIYQLFIDLTNGCRNYLFILPILVLIIVCCMLYSFKKGKDKRYDEFIKMSPGKTIKSESSNNTVGHSGSG
ncbi:MAG: hypothetical protein EP298_07395 [Gammaproteobacteria bacterium]|nr:MAG: hypothetical protein EP298_07395 [Gammaproteobacteria bacterium]UTW42665.1 hypothetical protein KFE69_00530 [bacterium SCSIO 12844]